VLQPFKAGSKLLGKMSANKIVVLGSNGRVGRELMEQISLNRKYKVFGFNKSNLNIIDHKKVSNILESIRPNTIINCAAYTNVDLAESNKKKCFAINVAASLNLHEISLRFNSHLINLSTASVFNSNKKELINLNQSRKPVNYYNYTKLKAEEISEEFAVKGLKVLNLRPYWIYSKSRKDFNGFVIDSIEKKILMKIVANQFGQPTSADLISKLIIESMKMNLTGFLPATSGGIANRVNWARKIVSLIGKGENLICEISDQEFPSSAKRPFNASLENIQWNDYNVRIPDCQEDLEIFFGNHVF
jgi:dTDP-4-dehydrorhamnose reductase